STPSTAFYTKRSENCRFRICGLGFSLHRPDLSPAHTLPDRPGEIKLPFGTTEASHLAGFRSWSRIALLPPLTLRQGNQRLQATPGRILPRNLRIRSTPRPSAAQQ